MVNRTLMRMREKIRRREYVMTVHAEEEMANDGFTIFDIERVVLTGRMIERQRDRQTGEAKYLVQGHGCTGKQATAVAKFGFNGKLIFITIFRN